ncbi:MAG: hypothetical protein RLZZ241_1139 [Bacteroidota bacterium]|jgi:uncharacterized membrane protein YphA (DoxX/SURF4 family)
MKNLVFVSRWIVGILFLISGFIKLNDPIGFSFKLEEYFSPAVLDLAFLSPLALTIALFVVILEVLLGVTLLIGLQVKATVWTLLGTIVFFTFLTLYSAVTGKVTDCGCFGDALKLTPWQSFFKDLVLLVLILILVWKQKLITSQFPKKIQVGIGFLALAASIGFAHHVLNHLPWIDFRPYKIGASIPDGIKIPADAPKPVVEYSWIFEVNGQEKTFVTTGSYPKVNGKFIKVNTREIAAGYEPPIHDFSLERSGKDYTESLMQEEKLLMIVTYDLDKSFKPAFSEIADLADLAIYSGYKVIGLTASSPEKVVDLKSEFGLDFPFYFADQTAIKTIVRSNPAVLLLDKGVILNKVHYNDLNKLIKPKK